MGHYYLLSQLPSLDGLAKNASVPISEEAFLDACRSSVPKETYRQLEALSLTPDRVLESTGIGLVDAWNARERQLRLALAKLRAEKMGKSFASTGEVIPGPLVQTARNACEAGDPLEAERILSRDRMAYLDALRPTDPFCDDALFYYGLKLKLLLRMQRFDFESGKAQYKRIYDETLHGQEQEDTQDGNH